MLWGVLAQRARQALPEAIRMDRWSFLVSFLIVTDFSQDSPLHCKLYFFCLPLKVWKGTTAKPGLKLEWNFIFPTEKCVRIRTFSSIQRWPGCASCWPDQKAPQQSKFKYQRYLICPSKLRNKATLPNYQQYKHTAPFKSGRRALLVFIASQGISPVLLTPLVSSVSCLPHLESFRAGNQTPCIGSHHLHWFMLAGQAKLAAFTPKEPTCSDTVPFGEKKINTTNPNP